VERMAAMDNIVFAPLKFASMVIPLITKSIVLMMNKTPAIILITWCDLGEANSHEFPVHPMSGWKVTKLKLRTTYQMCTNPCRMMKIPEIILDISTSISLSSGFNSIPNRVVYTNLSL
jgi:hypothetical protein